MATNLFLNCRLGTLVLLTMFLSATFGYASSKHAQTQIDVERYDFLRSEVIGSVTYDIYKRTSGILYADGSFSPTHEREVTGSAYGSLERHFAIPRQVWESLEGTVPGYFSTYFERSREAILVESFYYYTVEARIKVPGRATDLQIRSPFDPKTDRRPTLEWTPDSKATWSQIVVRRNGRFFDSNWLEGGTEWTPDRNLPVGNYVWYIRSWNRDGFSPWAGPASFSIELNLPTGGTQISPEGTIDDPQPTFQWTPGSAVAWTRLFLAGPRKFDQWIQGPTVDQWTPPVDLRYGSYTWYLRTWNTDGFGPWSDGLAFSFGQPSGLSPTGTVTGPMPTFTWNEVGGAQWYQIWITRNGSRYLAQWLNVADDLANPASPSFTPPSELPAGTYRWYIRAFSPTSGSIWSRAAEFESVMP